MLLPVAAIRTTLPGAIERTLSPQGERRTLFARDIVGTSDDILERLFADPLLPEVSELRLELPYEFEHEQYRQILHDFVTRIAPELGWSSAGSTAPDDERRYA